MSRLSFFINFINFISCTCVNSFESFQLSNLPFIQGKIIGSTSSFPFQNLFYYFVFSLGKPVKLSGCEVVLKLETPPAGSFAGRLFVSLVVLLFIVLISLKRKKLLKIDQKIHNQDNRKRKRYLFFHWLDYVIHYSEVSKPHYSLFTFNLNLLFFIQLPPPKLSICFYFRLITSFHG